MTDDDGQQPLIDFSPPEAGDPEAPLYLTDNGLPMLFDIAIPGDRLKAARIRLVQNLKVSEAPAPAPDIQAHIEAAIAAALPAALARAEAALREELLAEVQRSLQEKETETDPDRG